MGRLDDAAKRKVVELRRAGLSFRKIKAVLELENIKVSAQAIYLFLKEFQGKSTPERVDGRITQALVSVQAYAEGSAGAGRSAGWSKQQQWTMIHDPSGNTGYNTSNVDLTQHDAAPPALTENAARPSVTGGSRRTENVREEEEEIQIVSVTSLARGNKQRGSQVTEMSIGPLAGASLRKKVMLSPASNSILTARKRLLDKALLHKARIRETVSQPGQQGTAVSRRDLSGIPNSDSRKVCILSQAPSFGLNSSRTPVMKSRFGVQAAAGVGRRSCQQRASTSVRPLHPQLQRESLPCSAIQVAHAVSLPTDKQGTGMAAVRSQQSLGQPLSQGSQSPSTLLQKSAVDLSVQGGLPEQVQMLGIEMQNLGVAVRLLAEQQGRLEHEQAQQTLVQRQILSTLQGIALRMGPGSHRHTETSSASGTPTCNQAQFETGPVSYVPRSLPQPKLCESGSSGQEALESFKLSGLSPRKMNGGCEASSGNSSSGSGDGLSANHMPANSQTQMHVLSYEPMVYSQSYVPSYTEAYSQPQCDPPQNCSPSNHSSVTAGSPPSLLSNDSQFNIIKVETL